MPRDSTVIIDGDDAPVGNPIENSTVYVNGKLLDDGDQSNTVFVNDRGVGVGPIIEDVEDGSISDYKHDTGAFGSRQKTELEGDYLIRFANTSSGGRSIASDSRPRYPKQGWTHSVLLYFVDAPLWSGPMFAVANAGDVRDQALGIHVNPANNELRIGRYKGGGSFSDFTLVSAGSPPTGTPLELRWDWYSNGDIDARLYDDRVDNGGTQIASASATDPNAWSADPMGFYGSTNKDRSTYDPRSFFDYYRRIDTI